MAGASAAVSEQGVSGSLKKGPLLSQSHGTQLRYRPSAGWTSWQPGSADALNGMLRRASSSSRPRSLSARASADKVCDSKYKSGTASVAKEHLMMYGEFCQLTMDSVDLNPWSRYRDRNMYSEADLLNTECQGPSFPAENLLANLTGSESDLGRGHLSNISFFEWLPQACQPAMPDGYTAAGGVYLYASEEIETLKALRRRGQDIDTGTVWIGYVGYSEAAKDIVVAWRGTHQAFEWVKDAEVRQVPYAIYPDVEPVFEGKSMLENATGNLQSLLYAAAAFTLATVYGAIPAAAVFFAGGFVSGLFHSEGIFAAFFTAVYALFAALPIYKVILDRRLPILANAFDIVAELPQSALRLPKKIAPTQVFLGVWAVSALVMAALANWAVTDVVGRDMLIFTGPFWAVNGALVTGFSLLWLGLTSALVAWDAAGEDVRVHEGFWHLYNNIITIDRSLGRKAQAPGQTAREALLWAVRELIAAHTDKHPEDRDLTISVTGHSLGGALAVLSAFDIVESNYNVFPRTGGRERVKVRAIPFEAPRVGNPAFVKRFAEHKANRLTAVRIANKPDIVPDVPKAFFLQNIYYVICTLLNWRWGRDRINDAEKLEYWLKIPSAYQHPKAEDEYILDSTLVSFLKKMEGFINVVGNSAFIGTYHSLELVLFVLSSKSSCAQKAGQEFFRDFALCNKNDSNIDPKMGIAPNWIQTLSPNVGRAARQRPSKAAINEPYDKRSPYDNEHRVDDEREIGQGPGNEWLDLKWRGKNEA